MLNRLVSWIRVGPIWRSAIVIFVALAVVDLFAVYIIPAILGQEIHQNHERSDYAYGLQDPLLAFLASVIIGFTEFVHKHEKVLVTLAGIAVAAFTYTLWRATNRLWEAGEKQLAIAKKSADAAMLQAQAAIGVELPRFVLIENGGRITNITTVTSTTEGVRWNGFHIRIELKFINLGKTAAVVHEHCIVELITEGDSLPPEDIYHPLDKLVANDVSKVAENQGVYPVFYDLEIEDKIAKKIESGESSLWIHGFIGYRDFLRDTHYQGFCFLLNSENKWSGKEIGVLQEVSPHGYSEETTRKKKKSNTGLSSQF